MFITLYDHNFRVISNNSSLTVGNYLLSRRAYDLNEFSAICEPIELTATPMFATLKTNEGDRYYDMLAPLILRESDGKSKIVARDLYAVYNTECVIDFTVQLHDVREFMQYIYNAWKAFDISGFNVNLDLTSVTIEDPLYQPTEKAIYNVMDLFSKTMRFYGLYMSSEINMYTKTLDFKVRSQKENTRKIKLEEFGIFDFGKYQPEVNTAIAMDTGLNIRHNWYLLQNGSITTQSALRDIFPTSTRILTADDINQADFDAVGLLAENRYQEEIPVNIVYDYDRLSTIDFNTSFEVYYNGKYYKTLPIGEITDDGTKNRIIKLGYLPLDLIQLI